MEDHRYVVLLNEYQKPSDDQYRVTRSAETRASLDHDLEQNMVADDTTQPLPKKLWSAHWRDTVEMTDQLTTDPRPGGIYLLVRQ